MSALLKAYRQKSRANTDNCWQLYTTLQNTSLSCQTISIHQTRSVTLESSYADLLETNRFSATPGRTSF